MHKRLGQHRIGLRMKLREIDPDDIRTTIAASLAKASGVNLGSNSYWTITGT